MSQNEIVKHEPRELVIRRTFDAPRALVWEVWSKPEHVKEWWGPSGFTLTIDAMDFRTGGSFRMAMHGFGQDYPFSGTYEEVVPGERIVFSGEVHDGVTQRTVITFEDVGDKTRVVVQQVYSAESPATKGALAGWSQQHDKLADYLAKKMQ